MELNKTYESKPRSKLTLKDKLEIQAEIEHKLMVNRWLIRLMLLGNSLLVIVLSLIMHSTILLVGYCWCLIFYLVVADGDYIWHRQAKVFADDMADYVFFQAISWGLAICICLTW